MKNKFNIFSICLLLQCLGSCKNEFLDKKPSTDIVLLNKLDDLQHLLDNSYVFGKTGVLPQLLCDDYTVLSKADLISFPSLTQQNAYTWKKDLYSGETGIADWNELFKAIFYANNILDELNFIASGSNKDQRDIIKGSAYFLRAYAYYDLAKNFCKQYNEKTASTDSGLPLRKEGGVDVVLQRSSLQETYDFILADLFESRNLLKTVSVPVNNRNRPSKVATLALLARIYLGMGRYEVAGAYADSSIAEYGKLIDYNIISTSETTPFSFYNDETIFHSTFVYEYSDQAGIGENLAIEVSKQLLGTYNQNDLRVPIFFLKNTLGNYNIKRGYVGSGFYQFSGLATDEMYLIRAESFARQGNIVAAMGDINYLLRNRFAWNKFSPLVANTSNEALEKILNERRKELIWRGLRWSDLKRLNLEGGNIRLSRNIDDEIITLPANDPRYVIPVPEDEISLSGITQN